MIEVAGIRRETTGDPARPDSSAPAGAVAGARAQLRRATEDVHLALHGAEPFARIAAGQLDLGGYTRLLGMLARFHGAFANAVELAAAALKDASFATAAEHRRALLAADRSALGSAGALIESPQIDVLGDAWSVGCLYTLTGSTLGGKVIHRQLAYLLPGAAGRRFFAGLPRDGANWRNLCCKLDVYAARSDSNAAMIDGARFAFAHFAACLRESQ